MELADALSPDAKDGRLEALVDELYRYADSHPWPEEWLLHCRKELEHITADTLWQTQWMQYLLQRLEKTLQAAVSLCRAAQKICEKPAGPYMYAECLEQDEAFLQDCLAQSRQHCGDRRSVCTGRADQQSEMEYAFPEKDESVGEAERQQAKICAILIKHCLQSLRCTFRIRQILCWRGSSRQQPFPWRCLI